MKRIVILMQLFVAGLFAQSSTAPTFTFQVTSQWGTGLDANITIANPGSAAITNWTAQFTYPESITTMWNATLVSHVGNQYSIKNAGYNSTIPAGGSISLGFTATTTGAGTLSACSVDAITAVCPGDSTTQPVQGPPPTVTYAVSQNWGTGLDASFTITNPNSTPINAWTLQFTYPNAITSLWDGVIVSHTGNVYTVSGAGWDANIPAQGSATVGFAATVASASAAGPAACSVNGHSVSSASCPLSSPVSDTTPPTAPANRQQTAITTTSVTLQWNASTDAGSGVDHYTVSQNGVQVATATATQYQVTGLSPNTQYAFAVQAVDKAGNISQSSSTLTVTTTANLPTCVAPAAPQALTVTAATSSSLTLSWTLQPIMNCPVSYSVYLGSTLLTTVSTASYQFTGLQPSTSYTLGVAAQNSTARSYIVSVTASTVSAVPVSSGNWPSELFAPYTDMTLWPTPDLASMASTTGQKYYTLASIVSRNGCQAQWGGLLALNSFASQINSLRTAGGDIVISFGGANGLELAQACTSAETLEAQYQQAIDATGATRVDFDIEGAALADQASITRRNQAIAGLQAAALAKGKTLTVQFTLPALTTGLTTAGTGLLQSALQAGVAIGTVNIMAMDYGSAVPVGQMGLYAIEAATSLHGQLATLYPAYSSSQVWHMVGVTPMIGMNDTPSETFQLMDAQQLLAWALQNHIGFLAMWSSGRDVSCPSNGAYVSATCSGIVQTPNQFTGIFHSFTN